MAFVGLVGFVGFLGLRVEGLGIMCWGLGLGIKGGFELRV